MKYLLALIFINLLSFAQDQTHQQAVQNVRSSLYNEQTRKEYTQKHPQGQQAEAILANMPPAQRKQVLDLVLKIINQQGSGAQKHVDAYGKNNAQGAFNSFSPEMQNAIRKLAKQLEQNPQFMNNLKSNPQLLQQLGGK